MSNAIRYDALLVRDLAAELHTVLAGRRLGSVRLDRATLQLALRTRPARRSDAEPPSLLWRLHPEDGRIQRPGDEAPGGRVQIASPTFIRRVSAPADERIIHVDLDTGDDAPAGTARRLIIELVTNQWNALALGADDRITAVLRERRTGERELRAGVTYIAPARSARAGRDAPLTRAGWHDLLRAQPPGTRLPALVRSIAWTSPLNAAAILGAADTTDATDELDLAYDRYTDMVWERAAEPVLARLEGLVQPYARRIGDEVQDQPSLLAAFAAHASRDRDAEDAGAVAERALDIIAQRIEHAHRRIAKLRAQQEGAEAEAEQLRRSADLLLAQLHRVQRGASGVQLDDFEGGTLDVKLDPTLNGPDNARRIYDTARRRGRATRRIPRLVDEAEREIRMLEKLAAQVRNGTADPTRVSALRAPARTGGRADGPALPYREYRTSRGLEVRVGRGSRANDALTFRHSSPTDIWLHARDVAGAHVILRWPRATENPASSDIAEAANLAALYSRARTSGLVAVDWTRRKWVRKPRKAAPGAVVPERVRTVFVEPDAALEERLRADR